MYVEYIIYGTYGSGNNVENVVVGSKKSKRTDFQFQERKIYAKYELTVGKTIFSTEVPPNLFAERINQCAQ